MSGFNAEQHPYIQQALDRANRDTAFRKRLKQNPRAAIKEETGIDVPAGFGIRFVERFGRRNLTLVIQEPPEEPEIEEDDELGLEDLEEAAGGTGGIDGDPETPW